MSLQNPDNIVTEERLAEFYQQILPYLGGMPDVLANKFNRSDLYSLEEKIIGRWIDGKPIYEKTFTGLSVSLKNSWTTIVTIENGETCVGLTCRYPDHSVISAIEYAIDPSAGYVRCISYASTARTITSATVQYTKTTDSAVEIGSDTDYSTTEKIVGTWIDGKPIWQKTIILESSVTIGLNTYTQVFTPPEDIDVLVDMRSNSAIYMATYWNVANVGQFATSISGINTFNTGTAFTLLYTKTSS